MKILEFIKKNLILTIGGAVLVVLVVIGAVMYSQGGLYKGCLPGQFCAETLNVGTFTMAPEVICEHSITTPVKVNTDVNIRLTISRLEPGITYDYTLYGGNDQMIEQSTFTTGRDVSLPTVIQIKAFQYSNPGTYLPKGKAAGVDFTCDPGITVENLETLSAPVLQKDYFNVTDNNVEFKWSPATGVNDTIYYEIHRQSLEGIDTILQAFPDYQDTNYIDTTAKNGETYYYYVKAIDKLSYLTGVEKGVLKTSDSDKVQIVMPEATAPLVINNAFNDSLVSGTLNKGTVPAPTGLTEASKTSSSISLKWTASSGTVDGYIVHRTNPDGTTTESSLIADTLSYTDTNLNAGTTYGYQVYAKTGVTNSVRVPTEPLQISTKEELLGAPVNNYANQMTGSASSITLTQSVSASTVTLSWTPAVPALDPTTRDMYFIYKDGAKAAVAGADATSTTQTLSAGTYKYYVQAVRSGVLGEKSNEVSVTIAAAAPAPTTEASVTAPSDLNASVRGNYVTLSWTQGSGYTYIVSRDGRILTNSATGGYMDTVPASSTSVTYKYSVIAQDVSGAKSTAVTKDVAVPATATAPAPVAAANDILKAVVDAQKVNLAWPPQEGAVGYAIYRYDKASPSNITETQTRGIPNTDRTLLSYIDSPPAQKDTTYGYYLKLIDSSGAKSDVSSNTVEVLVKAATVAAPTADATGSTAPVPPIIIGATVSGQQVKVSWNAPAATDPKVGGYYVYRYTTDQLNQLNKAALSASTLEYTDTAPTLTTDVTYKYFVIAVSADLTAKSGRSREVSANVQGTSPTAGDVTTFEFTGCYPGTTSITGGMNTVVYWYGNVTGSTASTNYSWKNYDPSNPTATSREKSLSVSNYIDKGTAYTVTPSLTVTNGTMVKTMTCSALNVAAQPKTVVQDTVINKATTINTNTSTSTSTSSSISSSTTSNVNTKYVTDTRYCRFYDIASNNPGCAAVKYGTDTGIISGYANLTFLPKANINRAEAAKMLAGALDSEADASDYVGKFRDVKADEWYANGVYELYANNVVIGYVDKNTGISYYKPANYVTNAEFLKMLEVAAGEKANITECRKAPSRVISGREIKFNDVATLSWYCPYVSFALAQNPPIVMPDVYGKFNPNDPITRIAAAQMIYNAHLAGIW